MSVLAKFEKQPAEVQDYDIDFNSYLTAISDTGLSHVVAADAGITVASSTLNAGVVKVWIAGGADKRDYKISVALTTTGGRVHDGVIVIKVRA